MNEQDDLPRSKNTTKPSTTRIHIKLDQKLKSELKKKAADNFMSLSQLILQSTRHSTIVIKQVAAPKNSTEILALAAAQNKFGAQLNMIARHCNHYKESSDTLKILSTLIDIQREMQSLKASMLGDL